MKRLLSLVSAFGLWILVTGCASNPANMYGSKVQPISIIDVCQAQHDGKTADDEPVIVCDQIYNSAPHVLPPVDMNLTASAHADFYGSIKYIDGHYFIQDRNGQNYQMINQDNEPMKDLAKLGGGIPAHVMDTVYRVHGKMSLESEPATIQVSQMQPAIQLAPAAVASLTAAVQGERAPASLMQSDEN